jgi:hypothetical protein
LVDACRRALRVWILNGDGWVVVGEIDSMTMSAPRPE